MKTYTIKKGKFYSGFRFFPLFGKQTMTLTFMFHESCLYYPAGVYDQINKLGGMARGIDPHGDSIRLGWDSDGEIIRLWRYDYRNGVRQEPVMIKKILVNKEYTETIAFDSKPWFGVRLYPYFGGQLPAPREMKIDLEFN